LFSEKVKFTDSDHHGHAFFIQSTTTFLANLRRGTYTHKQQLPRTLNPMVESLSGGAGNLRLGPSAAVCTESRYEMRDPER
jgi:hypothetical protein